MSMWNDCPEPDLDPPEANEYEDEETEELEPDYESMAEREREDLEWEAEHAWHGDWNYPNDGRW